VNLFRYDISDFISNYDPQHIAMNQNFADIVIQGFEVYGEVFPAKDLTIRTGYTFNNAVDKSSGALTSHVRSVPKHKIDAAVSYLIPVVGVKTDLTALYVSQAYGQLPYLGSVLPVEKTPDYLVFNLRIAKNITKNTELYFMVKNLFDKDYYPELNFPAPGRNFFAGMRASF
jgi:outer membrane receptor protein involved in Fe transport